MKKTALLAPLALLLALAAGTSRPVASVTSPQSFLAANAPMAVVLQDEALERATLGATDVSSQLVLCRPCPTEPCEGLTCCAYDGEPCSWQGSGCSCQFCNGMFNCFR